MDLAGWLHLSIQGYLLLTELCFFFGPWPWIFYDTGRITLFLGGVHLAIFVSYRIARTRLRRMARAGVAFTHTIPNATLIKWVVVTALVLALPTSLSRTGSLVPNVAQGVSDLGSAYNDNFSRVSSGNPFAFVEYIRIILSPLLIGLVGVVGFFWKLMTPGYKVMAVAAVATQVAIYIAIGTNKGVADLAIMLPLFISMAKAIEDPAHRIVSNKFALIGIGAVILFLIFFGQTQELRAGGVGSSGVFNTGTMILQADRSRVLSTQWDIIYQSITRYLTQGYQPLLYALDIDYPSTYGFGNSMFLTDNADRLFSTDFFERSNLPAIIEQKFGWSRFYLWHTAYTWFMSDFGPIGTVVLIGLFAYAIFTTLVRLMADPNVVSLVLFQQLLTLFIYLPANNQIFQNGEGLVGTIGIIVISLISNRKIAPAAPGVAVLGFARHV
jgi:hypothetical protein